MNFLGFCVPNRLECFNSSFLNLTELPVIITLRQLNMNICGGECISQFNLVFKVFQRDRSCLEIWCMTLNLTGLLMTSSIPYCPQRLEPSQNTTTAQKQQDLDIAKLWSTEIVRNRTEQMDESLHLEEEVHSDRLPGLGLMAWAGCSGAEGVASRSGIPKPLGSAGNSPTYFLWTWKWNYFILFYW